MKAVRNISRAAFPFGDNMSKSLAELADEYLAEAHRIKKKIAELETKADACNPAAANHSLAVYYEMLDDLMRTYNTLKNYYK